MTSCKHAHQLTVASTPHIIGDRPPHTAIYARFGRPNLRRPPQIASPTGNDRARAKPQQTCGCPTTTAATTAKARGPALSVNVICFSRTICAAHNGYTRVQAVTPPRAITISYGVEARTHTRVHGAHSRERKIASLPFLFLQRTKRLYCANTAFSVQRAVEPSASANVKGKFRVLTLWYDSTRYTTPT